MMISWCLMVITCQHVLQSQEFMTNVTNDYRCYFDSTLTVTLNPCREHTFMLFSSCGPNLTPVLWGFLPGLVHLAFKRRAFKDGSDEKFLSPPESIHQNTTETIWTAQLWDKRRNAQTNWDFESRENLNAALLLWLWGKDDSYTSSTSENIQCFVNQSAEMWTAASYIYLSAPTQP